MYFKTFKELNSHFQLCFLEHNLTIFLKKVVYMYVNDYILCFFFGDPHITIPKIVLFYRAFCTDENVLE